jgi:hypothetical protein
MRNAVSRGSPSLVNQMGPCRPGYLGLKLVRRSSVVVTTFAIR